jgi:predicted Fe-Mo cluster-binding NifX family protein
LLNKENQMMVCVTAKGRDLSAPVDPNFGRAQFFLFVDDDGKVVKVLENQPGAHGAGVQSAQMVSQQGAGAVITGSVGPNACGGLAAAGLEIYTGATGTVQEALAAYHAGQLKRTMSPTSGGHRGAMR